MKSSPFLSLLFDHHALIWRLTQREIEGQYRSAYLGLVWSLITPLLMLGAYTFVFAGVFGFRWRGEGTTIEFALIIFTGLLLFNLFAECISRAPNLMFDYRNYIKKVIFPLEIAPIVVLNVALFRLLVSLIVLIPFYALIFGYPPPTFWLTPFLIVPFCALLLGLMWLLASLGVFLRDIGQLVAVVVPLLMLLSPIFYPLAAVPQDYQWLIGLNPLTPLLENVRTVLFLGQWPNLWFLLYSLICFAMAVLGFRWFMFTKKAFADVV